MTFLILLAVWVALLIVGTWAIKEDALKGNWLLRVIAVLLSWPIPPTSLLLSAVLWIGDRDNALLLSDALHCRKWFLQDVPAFVTGKIDRLNTNY